MAHRHLIDLDLAENTPDHQSLVNDIYASCESCSNPGKCAEYLLQEILAHQKPAEFCPSANSLEYLSRDQKTRWL